MLLTNKRFLITVAAASLLIFGGLTMAVGQDDDADWNPKNIVDTNPVVEKTGANQLIISNDPEINRTKEGNLTLFEVTGAGTRWRYNDNNPASYRVDKARYTLKEATRIGQLSDGYREMLDNKIYVPQEQSWVDWNSVNIERVEIRGAFGQNSTDPIITDDELTSVYVKREGQTGLYRTKNVEVLYDENRESNNNDGYYVSNPGEAKIYEDTYKSHKEINRDTTKEDFEPIRNDTAIVPVIKNDSTPRTENEERWETESISVSGPKSGSHVVIDDHWAQVTNLFGAAYAGDNFVLADTNGFNASHARNYKFKTPPDYTRVDECTYYDDDGDRQTGSETHYEKWTLEFKDTKHHLQYGIPRQKVIFDGDAGIASFEKSTQRSSFTGLSRVTAKWTVNYGIKNSGSCDTDTSDSVTKKAQSVRNTGLGKAVKPATADDLDITVYKIEKSDGHELYFDIVGDQSPLENPLGKITVEANQECTNIICTDREYQDSYTFFTPWSFYTQSLYNGYELRYWDQPTQLRNSTVDPTVDKMGFFTRDYLDSGTYRISTGNTIITNIRGREVSEIYKGQDLGEQVSDNQNTTTLYRLIGGDINSHGNGEDLNDISEDSITALDVHGNEVNKEYVTRTYTATDLAITVDKQNQIVNGTLTEKESENPIQGKNITINANDVVTVTTDNNGEFSYEYDNMTTSVSAKFEGDDFRDNLGTYYEQAEANRYSPQTAYSYTAGTVLGYVTAAISNLLLFAEWMLLGLFMVWWTKYREEKPT